MRLSAPIHVLKAQAQVLKKEKSITNTEALDLIAVREGFGSWSLLQSKKDDMFPKSYDEILSFFNSGDIVLIGAEESKGKTVFTMGLFVQAIQKKSAKNFCFSLVDAPADIIKRMTVYDELIHDKSNFFKLDNSKNINADYIIEKTKDDVTKNSLIVIDYLQLLDEKKINPALQVQVEKLKNFAKAKECVVIFISKIGTEIENSARKPIMEDICLPSTLELKFFNKIILLHKPDETTPIVDVLFYRPKEFSFKVGWDDYMKFHSI